LTGIIGDTQTMSTLSEQDRVTIVSAITRAHPDVKEVSFETTDDKTFVCLQRHGEERRTRYLLGTVKRDASGHIVPATIALLDPAGDSSN
jgi:hypothetical protein